MSDKDETPNNTRWPGYDFHIPSEEEQVIADTVERRIHKVIKDYRVLHGTAPTAIICSPDLFRDLTPYRPADLKDDGFSTFEGIRMVIDKSLPEGHVIGGTSE